MRPDIDDALRVALDIPSPQAALDRIRERAHAQSLRQCLQRAVLGTSAAMALGIAFFSAAPSGYGTPAPVVSAAPLTPAPEPAPSPIVS